MGPYDEFCGTVTKDGVSSTFFPAMVLWREVKSSLSSKDLSYQNCKQCHTHQPLSVFNIKTNIHIYIPLFQLLLLIHIFICVLSHESFLSFLSQIRIHLGSRTLQGMFGANALNWVIFRGQFLENQYLHLQCVLQCRHDNLHIQYPLSSQYFSIHHNT